MGFPIKTKIKYKNGSWHTKILLPDGFQWTNLYPGFIIFCLFSRKLKKWFAKLFLCATVCYPPILHLHWCALKLFSGPKGQFCKSFFRFPGKKIAKVSKFMKFRKAFVPKIKSKLQSDTAWTFNCIFFSVIYDKICFLCLFSSLYAVHSKCGHGLCLPIISIWWLYAGWS